MLPSDNGFASMSTLSLSLMYSLSGSFFAFVENTSLKTISGDSPRINFVDIWFIGSFCKRLIAKMIVFKTEVLPDAFIPTKAFTQLIYKFGDIENKLSVSELETRCIAQKSILRVSLNKGSPSTVICNNFTIKPLTLFLL